MTEAPRPTTLATVRRSLLALVLATTAVACAKGNTQTDGGATIDGGQNQADAGQSGADAGNGADAGQGTPDAGGTCPKSPCDLVQQCGCSSPQVCDLNSAQFPSGGTACRDVLSPGTENNDCGSQFDCAGGNVCIGTACRKYCNVDADCSGEGGLCIVQLTFGSPPTDIPGAKVCTRSCEPEKPTANGCPPSENACHIYQYDPDGTPNSGDEELLTDCDPAGGGGNNASCTTNGSRDCQAGYDCVNTGSLVCKQNCQCPSPGNCAGGVCTTGTCTAYSEPLMIGTTEYGVCL